MMAMQKDKRGRVVVDSKVNHSGRGRLLAMGKLLPDDFDYVRITITRTSENTVWLSIRKLELAEAD